MFQRASVRKGTVSATFGTNDIADCSQGVEVVVCERSYDTSPPTRIACGHRHTSRKAAWRCARSMARGWLSSVSPDVASRVRVLPDPTIPQRVRTP